MSYSADERLSEDYFKGVMEEKAEMLRKYLKDLGDPLNILVPLWIHNGDFQILFI